MANFCVLFLGHKKMLLTTIRPKMTAPKIGSNFLYKFQIHGTKNGEE